MTISLCLLIWNELEGCKLDVPSLPREKFEEVYAIDGGSTDGTVAYLEGEAIPVYRQPVKGLNAAYRYAVEKSRCEAVVVFFPKGTIPPLETAKFRPLLEIGKQLVVASRNIKGARNEEDAGWFKPRKTCVTALACLIALLWRREGYMIRDVLHGVKAFTVAAFKQMNPSNSGHTIDLELAVRAYRLRLERAEFPTTEVARPHGHTHFKVLPIGWEFLTFIWHEFWRSKAEIGRNPETF
jgi:glycosyltransferase involved in cell wall biosynthesis